MTHIVPRIRPGILQLPALFGLILFGSLAPRGVWSQTPESLAPPPSETKANPFSGFETYYLSNGLRVWFKRLPQAPNVSPNVGEPTRRSTATSNTSPWTTRTSFACAWGGAW